MIRMECPNCGAKLRGPDDSAGKTTRCPQCGTAVTIPEPVYEAEELVPGDEFGLPIEGQAPKPSPPPDPDASGEEARRPCPVCGEMIVAGAAKCRFCGEIFDPNLRKKARRISGADLDADLSTGDWVVAILCSGIGCIAGVIWMIQGKPKGGKMLGLSILFGVMWNVLSLVFQAVVKP